MKRRLKLKIYGESPRSLFLAYIFAEFKWDVYLLDSSNKFNSSKDDQIFSFSNFSKDLLSKFGSWNEFEEISYCFNSFCLNDNLVSDQIIFRSENFSKEDLNPIAWTANSSEIKKLLIEKLINLDNVHFITRNQLIDESMNFDFEFNFTSYGDNLKLFKFPLFTIKNDEKILIFNVYLRGNIQKRLYEINTNEGLLVFTPLKKNLYQVIWNKAPNQIQKRSFKSKSFFLDNLTTLLPSELKIDQIIGEINSIYVHNFNPIYLIKSKSIYFNENKFTSNTLYDLDYDIFIRNIVQIFSLLGKNNNFKHISFFNKLRFYYLLVKNKEFIINFSFSNLLIKFLSLNNMYLLLLRKILFILFKRINLLSIFFIRKSNINNTKSIHN